MLLPRDTVRPLFCTIDFFEAFYTEIVTISRSNWAKMPGSTFSDKNVMGAVTAMTLSPNGVYLITAIQSWVHVWSTQTRRVVTRQVDTRICPTALSHCDF